MSLKLLLCFQWLNDPMPLRHILRLDALEWRFAALSLCLEDSLVLLKKPSIFVAFAVVVLDARSLTNPCHPEERSDERQTKIPALNKNTIGIATRHRADKTFSMLN